VGALTLRGVDARGSVGQGTMEIALTGGAWRRGAPQALGAGHGLLRVSSDLDITIDALDMKTARSTLHTSGRLGILGMLARDPEIAAALDLRDAAIHGTRPGGTVAVKGRAVHRPLRSTPTWTASAALRPTAWTASAAPWHGVAAADRSQLDLHACCWAARPTGRCTACARPVACASAAST
jgi:hypothetical protein